MQTERFPIPRKLVPTSHFQFKRLRAGQDLPQDPRRGDLRRGPADAKHDKQQAVRNKDHPEVLSLERDPTQDPAARNNDSQDAHSPEHRPPCRPF